MITIIIKRMTQPPPMTTGKPQSSSVIQSNKDLLSAQTYAYTNKAGIYVSIASEVPLFSSKDKI